MKRVDEVAQLQFLDCSITLPSKQAIENALNVRVLKIATTCSLSSYCSVQKTKKPSVVIMHAWLHLYFWQYFNELSVKMTAFLGCKKLHSIVISATRPSNSELHTTATIILILSLAWTLKHTQAYKNYFVDELFQWLYESANIYWHSFQKHRCKNNELLSHPWNLNVYNDV